VNIAGAAASPFLPQTATAPSAPSLGSFYSTSNVTELSSASAQEHQSNGFGKNFLDYLVKNSVSADEKQQRRKTS